eukprot:13633889-Ditylum_brightwellii.AAC.1
MAGTEVMPHSPFQLEKSDAGQAVGEEVGDVAEEQPENDADGRDEDGGEGANGTRKGDDTAEPVD